MYAKTLLTLVAMLCLVAVDKAATAAPPDSLASINGHGMWVLDTGDVYPNHQPYIESTTIDAWLDADGIARGTIVWMDTFNGLNDHHGQGVSGYTWQVDVDTILVISDHEVYVEGTIFHSNVEGDIGSRNGFYVYDGGPSGTDYIYFWPSDPLSAFPVLQGNFQID